MSEIDEVIRSLNYLKHDIDNIVNELEDISLENDDGCVSAALPDMLLLAMAYQTDRDNLEFNRINVDKAKFSEDRLRAVVYLAGLRNEQKARLEKIL
jgi:hypothetical protein